MHYKVFPMRAVWAGLLAFLLTTASAWGQLIIAHRGASFEAPENTLSAFRLAWQKDADGVEGDFYLTRDGQIVCMHDADTKRTAGVDMNVADATLAELRCLDVGSWKGPRFGAEVIPTLGEVLATVPCGKQIYIEIKCGPEIVPVLRRELEAARIAPGQVRVISFQSEVVAEAKRQLPGIEAYWLTGYKKDEKTGKWTPTLDQVLDVLRRTGADGLGSQANIEVIDGQFVRRLHEAGMELNCWTINDPEKAAHLHRLGAISITTDRPAYLRRGLQ